MLRKLRKVLKSESGFTLVELMTVLIILAIVLGIGIPKYLQLQAKSGWDADANTIDNFARAAETYAASINHFSDPVSLDDLIEAGLIDGNLVLNRESNATSVSLKNKGETDTPISEQGDVVKFSFNEYTGNVNNRAAVIKWLIGNPPYGTGPVFPTDSEKNEVTWEGGAARGEAPSAVNDKLE